MAKEAICSLHPIVLFGPPNSILPLGGHFAACCCAALKYPHYLEDREEIC